MSGSEGEDGLDSYSSLVEEIDIIEIEYGED